MMQKGEMEKRFGQPLKERKAGACTRARGRVHVYNPHRWHALPSPDGSPWAHCPPCLHVRPPRLATDFVPRSDYEELSLECSSLKEQLVSCLEELSAREREATDLATINARHAPPSSLAHGRALTRCRARPPQP